MKKLLTLSVALLCAIVSSAQITISESVVQPVNCYNSGTITLSGMLPSTAYQLHYSKNSVPQPTTVINTTASGTYVLAYLSQGTYSNIYVTRNSVNSNVLGPDVITNPSSVNISITGNKLPTSCTANDGLLYLTGLTPNSTFTYSYNKNGGATYTSALLIADNTGNYIFSGITEGVYTNIRVKPSATGCESNYISSYTLTYKPATPTSVIPIGTCTDQGEILLSGYAKNTNYLIDYKRNGVQQPTQTFFTYSSDGVSLWGLTPAFYDSITVRQAGCAAHSDYSSATVAQLSLPPVTLGISSVSPSVCMYSDGSITVTGMVPNSGYYLYYTTDNPIGTGARGIISNGSGSYTYEHAPGGHYSNIYVGRYGCYSDTIASATLTLPVTPAVLQTSASPSCMYNGTIKVGGLMPNKNYTYTYTKNGVPSATSALVSSSSTGTFLITGLGIGNYDSIKFRPSANGCVSSPPIGPVTLTTPPPQSVTTAASTTSIIMGDSVTFTSNVQYGGINVSYQWKKNGVAIPLATNSVYGTRSLANGDSISCYVTTNLCSVVTPSVSNVIEMHVAAMKQSPTRVNYLPENDVIKLYPNPTKSILFVDSKEPVTIQVTDMMGKIVTAVSNENYVDMSQLASGMYIVQLYNAEGVLQQIERITKE